jgi:hypothetical protein
MCLSRLGVLPLLLLVGCGPASTPQPTTGGAGSVQPTTPNRGETQPRKAVAETTPARKDAERKPDERPTFDDKEMIRPVIDLRGYTIDDYRKLPNCLVVFKDCLAVPFEGKTSEQYKDAVLQLAQRPCRVVLKVVDIPADYDYAEFELLTDDGESGMAALKQGGDLGNYTRHLRTAFPINDVKKAKGLDSKRLSIGDRVVLVGLGYVVAASPWGSASPRHGMPRGDERQVMLRAFGKPNKYHPNDYEFSFMVRNWYIASQ